MVIWVITWLGIPLVEWFLTMVDTLEFYMWDVPTSSQYIYIYIYKYIYLFTSHIYIYITYIYIYITYIYIYHLYIYISLIYHLYYIYIYIYLYMCLWANDSPATAWDATPLASPWISLVLAGIFFHALVWPCAIHQPNQFRAAAWEGPADDHWRSKHWKSIATTRGKLAWRKNGNPKHG